jgi:hypothetical protein
MFVEFDQERLRIRERYNQRITVLWLICLFAISSFAVYQAVMAEKQYHSPAVEALKMNGEYPQQPKGNK